MFYDQLQEICRTRGIKPTNLLIELNLSTGSLSNWKKGVTPKGEILEKIATRLDVSTDYLLGKTEKTNQSKAESDIPLNSVVVSRNGIRTTVELKPEEALTFENLLKQIREAHGDK